MNIKYNIIMSGGSVSYCEVCKKWVDDLRVYGKDDVYVLLCQTCAVLKGFSW